MACSLVRWSTRRKKNAEIKAGKDAKTADRVRETSGASVLTQLLIMPRLPPALTEPPRNVGARAQAKDKDATDKAAAEEAAKKDELNKKREENVAKKAGGKAKVPSLRVEA